LYVEDEEYRGSKKMENEDGGYVLVIVEKRNILF